MKENITILDFKNVFEQIKKSKFIFYCAPGITKEIGPELRKLANEVQKIFIVCDLDEQNDYRGLNEIDELSKLYKSDNVHFKNSKGINVSLISNFEEYNYFLFPVSKIIKKVPEGYNAVTFDGFRALSLFTLFFPEEVNELQNEFNILFNSQKKIEIERLDKIKDPIQELSHISLEVVPVTIRDIENIQKTVKEFPPEKPDLQRKVNFINTFIQVVDLKFEGSNWQSRKITIPQKLNSFISEDLKQNMESKLKIFSKDDSNESLNEFENLKKQVDELRKEFTFRSKQRNKSILKLNEKEAFKNKVESLKLKVNDFKESLFETVNSQIEKNEKEIKNELYKSYLSNPRPEFKEYKGQASFEKRVMFYVESIMKELKFPSAIEITDEMKLTLSFLNFTAEDFEDDDFLSELADWHKLSTDEYYKLFEKEKGFQVLKN